VPVLDALPVLFLGSHLVAPWPTVRVLSPKQAAELRPSHGRDYRGSVLHAGA
jgi:hypothetical protein